MHVTVIEPYATGSHAAWLAGLQRFSHHEVSALTLPGRFWKWRMHGGAVTLGRTFLGQGLETDLLLATDMLDLATFLGVTRHQTSGLPTALYFHENQLTYPPPPGETRDLHYGWVNTTSALAADRVFFNSAYHRDAFLEELPRLLKHFPDYTELATVEAIEAKSTVLPLGLDLRRFDDYGPAAALPGPLRIVWNHRWEYDKGPEMFFQALAVLAEEDAAFEVIVLGENFRQQPEEFDRAAKQLGKYIRHFGYVEDFATYARLLWEADVQVSCALQEFFGASTCEAMACGCVPIVPNRLNYPALIPAWAREICVYEGFAGLMRRLRWAIENVGQVREMTLREAIEGYDWRLLADTYDKALAEAAGLPQRERA
jgi:glycosyltransferase involved in cell wall biosynthesis